MSVRRHNNHPIHGFLTNASQWEVVEAKADQKRAWVTSRLEFYRHPRMDGAVSVRPHHRNDLPA